MHLLIIGGSAVGQLSMSRTVFEKVVNYTNENLFQFTHDEVFYRDVKKEQLDELVQKADLIAFTTSPFHCNIQAGLAEFIIKNFADESLAGKPVIGFISSSGLFEKTCESQLRTLLTKAGAKYISGYSSIEYEFLENHEKPADINVRTGNNIDDMGQWLAACLHAVDKTDVVTSDEPTVVITTLSNYNKYLTNALNIIKSKYTNVEVIYLENYKITPCTGCKYCYTDKVCCMKDDMQVIEEKVSKYDNIIHIVDMVGGILDTTYLKYMQRDVHNGLYPYPDGVGKKVIRIVKSNGFETNLIEEYLTSLASFGRQFSTIIVDNDIDDFIVRDAILEKQREAKTFPNMDGYCKFFTRHFGNLAVMLQNVLQKEYAFFKDHPYAKPSAVNKEARPIHKMDDAKMSQVARIYPVTEFMKPKKKGLLGSIWKK